MRHVWNDAMRHPIFSRPFSCRVAMESTRVRNSLWSYRLRRVRACNSDRAHGTSADKCFHAASENIFACLSHLRAGVKLGLFAAALAQLLNALRPSFASEKPLFGLSRACCD